MAQLKGIFKRIVLIIVLLSLLIGFCATPASYAKLTLEDGEFYYSGTTKGSYVASSGIFSWLNDMLAQLGTFLLNLITYGIRMVFIGWTALIEKILTWALESASGVNLEGEDISSTDLSAISDSTNNVTVQAIVYNRVPALNVNFFDTDISSIYLKDVEDEDGTVVTKAYSPTGQELICSKCGKNVTECCDSIDKTKIGEINDPKVDVTCNASSTDDCKCNGCDACKTYAEMYNAEDPIIIQLKNLVAVWYNLIRVLALAAMLIVLLFVGIKMALSTVASDKAVYKRMLVDWIVGVAIIFLIHYFMYLAIIITETLVDTVADVGDQVHQVTMMQITDSNDTDESEISDQDLEIDMYEEIRTRAYDFNLSIGLTGMIMYMTLVFMAIKYTLIYIKRFLTLAVLTMMAPAVGVAYAIQKTLSGKSSSLKTWMTEYILNLIIQVVHALIYAVFVSAALVFSLENVSGIIVALIFLNFASDAEKIFRRIFNLDPGGKGLLGGTEGAGDIDKKIKEAKGMAVGAKPLAKMASWPARKAIGLTGKTAAGAYGLLASSKAGRAVGEVAGNAANAIAEGADQVVDAAASVVQPVIGGVSNAVESAKENVLKDYKGSYKNEIRKLGPKTREERKKEDKELMATDEDSLKKKLAEETKTLEKMKDDDQNKGAQMAKVVDAQRRLTRQRELLHNKTEKVTTGGVIVGHLKNISSVNNNFNLVIDSDGNLKTVRKTAQYNPKTGKYDSGIKRAMYGYHKYNPVTGRYEKVKDGTFSNQFSSENLLGLSKEDKKFLKEQVLNPAVKGIGGMASMFVGMGTLVTNPTVGMAALATGAGYTYNMRKKFKKPKGYKYSKKRFRFGHFSTRAQLNIADSVVQDANKALATKLIADRDAKKHPLGKIRKVMSNPALHAATLISNKTGISKKFANMQEKPFYMRVPYNAGKAAGKAALTVISAPVSLPFNLYGVGKNRLKKMANDTGINQNLRKMRFKNRHDPFQLNDNEKLRLYSPGNSVLEQVDRMHAKNVKKLETQFREDAYRLMAQQAEINAEFKLEAYARILEKAISENDRSSQKRLAELQEALKNFQNPQEVQDKLKKLEDELKPKQEELNKKKQELQEKLKDYPKQTQISKQLKRINKELKKTKDAEKRKSLELEKAKLEQQSREIEQISKDDKRAIKKLEKSIEPLERRKENLEKKLNLFKEKEILEQQMAKTAGVDVDTFLNILSKNDDLNLEIIVPGLSRKEKEKLREVIKDKKDLNEVNELYEEAKKEADMAGVTVSDKADSGKPKTLEEKQDEIIAIYLAMGFVYDEKTKSFKRKEESASDDTGKKSKKKKDADSDTTVIATKKITEKDVTTINRELNNAIVKQLQGKQIDVNDEKVLDSIMKDLSSSLAKQGILGVGQNADVLFKAGRDGLKSRIKDNATKVNEEVISKKTNLSTQQVDVVKQAIQEVAQKATKDANGNVDMSKLNQDEIYNIVAEKLNLETSKTQQDKSEPPKDSGNGQPQKPEKKPTNISDKIDDIQKDNVKKAIASMVGSKENSINPNSDTELEKAMVSNVGPLNDEQTKDVKQKLTIEEPKNEKSQTAKEVLGNLLDSIDSKSESTQTKEDARKEKLEQIQKLGLEEREAKEVTSTVVDALFAMKEVNDEMKTDLQAINVSAEEVLPESSSIKSKARRNKNYLLQKIDLYDKKSAEEGVKLKESQERLEKIKNTPLQTTESKKKSEQDLKSTISKLTEDIEKTTKKKEEAMRKTKPITGGPVVDVDAKTKDVIGNLKKGYM